MAKYGLENEAGDALEQYPYTFKMWKDDNNISMREDMALVAAEYPRVVEVTERGPRPDPSDPALFRVVVGPVVKEAGQWRETWAEEAKSAEEQAEYAEQQDMKAALEAANLDGFLTTFYNMTPAEAKQFVQDNPGDAVLNLSRLAYAVNVLAKVVIRGSK